MLFKGQGQPVSWMIVLLILFGFRSNSVVELLQEVFNSINYVNFHLFAYIALYRTVWSLYSEGLER